MNTKHTFWTLCQLYSKIEIPIIQRDYAQGRATKGASRIRTNFIDNYLIKNLLKLEKIELDFVYGSVFLPDQYNEQESIFIPLDGQQRLTTLFLLHWFLALKEGKIADAKENLLKFTYETRPSAHSFCRLLIEKHHSKNIANIKQEIIDAAWYDEEWAKDPSVAGMLRVLDTFARNKALVQAPNVLFDALIDTKNPLISFYFIPLKEFGLTENLYIRMNARGKMLTSFENFKSEFYKIISSSQDLAEEVKNKIEYDWVDNLWEYRENKGKTNDSFVVDNPFMQYLSFITEMLYFKQAKFRATENYESNFLDFALLEKIYADEENLKFFIFAYDSIKELKEHTKVHLLWPTKTKISASIHIPDILEFILDGKRDISHSIVLFSSLRYYYKIKNKNKVNFYDFIRVVRNLVENTRDRSKREWPKLLNSIEHLIQDKNVYEQLLASNIFDLLEGFSVPQRREEIAKAKIIHYFPAAKEKLFEAEDDHHLTGNISMLIAANFVSKEADLGNFTLNDSLVNFSTFNIAKFASLLKAYKDVSKDDFTFVWGDLINSSIYTQLEWSRLVWDENYKKAPTMISFIIDYEKKAKKLNLDAYQVLKQKQFIRQLLKKHPNFSSIRKVKQQLYLYYILHLRILGKGYSSFFKNGNNFGWLTKEKGFSSIFNAGIKDDEYFDTVNPIFQTYNIVFRYNSGLRKENTLDEEIVGKGRKNNPFELLINWANED